MIKFLQRFVAVVTRPREVHVITKLILQQRSSHHHLGIFLKILQRTHRHLRSLIVVASNRLCRLRRILPARLGTEQCQFQRSIELGYLFLIQYLTSFAMQLTDDLQPIDTAIA